MIGILFQVVARTLSLPPLLLLCCCCWIIRSCHAVRRVLHFTTPRVAAAATDEDDDAVFFMMMDVDTSLSQHPMFGTGVHSVLHEQFHDFERTKSNHRSIKFLFQDTGTLLLSTLINEKTDFHSHKY